VAPDPTLTVTLPIGSAPLKPLLPGQCLLFTDGHLFSVEEGDLWLDFLYIRLKRSLRDVSPSLVYVGFSGWLWLTGVTLQGDGKDDKECFGLEIESQAYAEGMAMVPRRHWKCSGFLGGVWGLMLHMRDCSLYMPVFNFTRVPSLLSSISCGVLACLHFF
jgi:hypothetical protein